MTLMEKEIKNKLKYLIGDNMILTTDKYNEKEIFRFMREATNLTQKEFGESINKSKDWVRKNEYGITNYYFKDLVKIAKIHGFEIKIIKK